MHHLCQSRKSVRRLPCSGVRTVKLYALPRILTGPLKILHSRISFIHTTQSRRYRIDNTWILVVRNSFREGMAEFPKLQPGWQSFGESCRFLIKNCVFDTFSGDLSLCQSEWHGLCIRVVAWRTARSLARNHNKTRGCDHAGTDTQTK